MKGSPHIRRLALRLMTALLTFLIGVAAAAVWSSIHNQQVNSPRLLLGQPCREGLVSVESRPDVPLRVTISDTACEHPRSAKAHFIVENLSTKPISKYKIRAVLTYDELIDEGLGVSTETVEPLQPHQTQSGFLGGGVLTRAGGRPVSELRSFQLVVWSVTFSDGTTWTRSSRNEIPAR